MIIVNTKEWAAELGPMYKEGEGNYLDHQLIFEKKPAPSYVQSREF